MTTSLKTAEDFASFGQANVEALVKSGQIWSAGLQDMARAVAATAQARIEHTMSTAKAVAGARSLKEAMDLQAAYARAAMETTVAETGRLTDATLKLAGETIAPLSARVNLAMDAFGRTPA